MSHKKEQDKTPEEKLSDMELGSLSEKKFRVRIIKMIQELGKRIYAWSENLQKLLTKSYKI